MGLHVALHVKFGEELPLALSALEAPRTLVDFHVLVQVCSLGESEATIGVRAIVRSFVCMNSQVVEEVVPFTKMLTTVSVIAFKYFYDSF